MCKQKNWQKQFHSKVDVLEIISDGALGITPFANGKIIPLLIINTAEFKILEEFITIHKEVGPGNVTSKWGLSLDKKAIVILLEFSSPMSFKCLLALDVKNYGLTIELIMQSQLLYIQAGKPGDKLRNTVDNDRVLIEIPSKYFLSKWEEICKKSYYKFYRQQGIPRRHALKIAEELFVNQQLMASSRVN